MVSPVYHASPGGWTWVLLALGAQVDVVDRAPLDPRLSGHPRLEFREGSAFGLDPRAAGRCDWLFSDVVCYPERLAALVRRWLDAGVTERLICTVKLQGRRSEPALDALAALPGARLVHLHHNKHELTFVRLPGPEWTLGEFAPIAPPR
jgi:23S rRNA (cytidine2498-2'-O)-methyltransferase